MACMTICSIKTLHHATPVTMRNTWKSIDDLLLNAMHIFIPMNKIHSNQQHIWFNSEITHCIKQLKTLRRRYKCHPTHHILNRINSLENILQDKINIDRQNFECNLISSYALTNNKNIYILKIKHQDQV